MSDGSSGPTASRRRSTSASASASRPGEEVVPARRCRRRHRPAGDHDRCPGSGSSTPVAAQHGDVVGAEEVGDGHQDPGPAAAQDVRRLDALEPGVDRHQRRRRPGSRPSAAITHSRAVERPDRDPVAGPDAGLDQRGRERARGLEQLGVRKPGLAVDNGRPIGESLGGSGADIAGMLFQPGQRPNCHLGAVSEDRERRDRPTSRRAGRPPWRWSTGSRRHARPPAPAARRRCSPRVRPGR